MANEKVDRESVPRSTDPPKRELPKPGEEGALIGVCGTQGAGKTVFLTCVYQTSELAVPSHGELTFDRKEVGGARYFANIEAEIRSHGTIPGTKERERVPARLLLRIDDRDSSLSGQRLPIDLVDFAGKYFDLFADLGPSLDTGNLPVEDKRDAHEISAILEHCDGLIILVSAALFNQGSGKPRDNPFPKSVTYLIDDCRRTKRPLALVFSQADTNPELTLEKIETFERVRRFRQQFTASLEEALKGLKPFGTVELLSCYELDLHGPKLQNAEGSIWRPEAGRVFMQVVKAVWPKVRQRLEEHRGAKPSAPKPQPKKPVRLPQPRASWSLPWARSLLAATLLTSLLGGGGFFAHRYYQLQEAVGLVRETSQQVGSGATVSPERIKRLQDARQLEKSGSAPFDTQALQSAFGDLRQSLENRAETYLAKPALTREHQDEITNLLVFEEDRDPAQTPWWSPVVSRKLEARASFLASWNGGGNPGLPQDPVRRIDYLRQQQQLFARLGDEPFRLLLVEAITRQEREHVDSLVQTALGSATTLQTRAEAIRTLLADAQLPADAESRFLLRERLSGELVAAILELDENPRLRSTLGQRLPEAKNAGAKGLQLPNLLLRIAQLPGTWDLSIEPFRQAARARRTVVKNALADLFRGLDTRERTEIWRAMLAQLDAGYLFDRSAMVDGIFPLPQRLESVLRRTPLSASQQAQAEALLLEHPFYYNELLVIELKTLLKAY